MEYIVLSNIVIQQIPNAQWPFRKKVIEFSFMGEYTGHSTWEELTQTMHIILPKRVRVKYSRWDTNPLDLFPPYSTGVVDFYTINDENSNIGGFNKEPLFLRGDLITFNTGYRTYLNRQETVYMTGGKDPTGNITGSIPAMFKGFISKVDPKLPFSISCEDNTWLLKQMHTPVKMWPNGTTINNIISSVIKNSQQLDIISRYKGYVNMVVSDHSVTDLKFNVNNITTYGESLANFMARLKSQYKIYSYFRGDELRVGYTVYVPEEAVQHDFTFQKNIIHDRLAWQRMDDHIISIVVKSNYAIETGATTTDGKKITKAASTEILIFNDQGTIKYVQRQKGKDYPAKYLNTIGERYTMNYYSPITDVNTLFAYGKEQLKKFYYDGFRGSFTTFGIPYVKHGDTVKITDAVLPERNGLYKVKGVKRYGGFDDGLRQEIFLDYKISA